MKKPRPVTIYDPDKEYGKVEKGRKKSPNRHNTKLNTGRMTMQASCKCFGGRITMGCCAGHFAEMHSRLFYAEAALRDGKGLALAVGARLGAVEALLGALLEAARPKFLAPEEGDSPGVVALVPTELMHRVKLTLDELRTPLLEEAPPAEEP